MILLKREWVETFRYPIFKGLERNIFNSLRKKAYRKVLFFCKILDWIRIKNNTFFSLGNFTTASTRAMASRFEAVPPEKEAEVTFLCIFS